MFHADRAGTNAQAIQVTAITASTCISRDSPRGIKKNTEDRDDGHDCHGELDVGFGFLGLGHYRPIITIIIMGYSHIVAPALATAGGFLTIIRSVRLGRLRESTCRWEPTAPADFSSALLRRPARTNVIQSYYNTYETRGQRYIPSAEPEETIRWGPSSCHKRPLPVSPYAAHRLGTGGHGPSLERKSRAAPLPSGGSGLTSMTRKRFAAVRRRRWPSDRSQPAARGFCALSLSALRGVQVLVKVVGFF